MTKLIITFSKKAEDSSEAGVDPSRVETDVTLKLPHTGSNVAANIKTVSLAVRKTIGDELRKQKKLQEGEREKLSFDGVDTALSAWAIRSDDVAIEISASYSVVESERSMQKDKDKDKDKESEETTQDVVSRSSLNHLFDPSPSEVQETQSGTLSADRQRGQSSRSGVRTYRIETTPSYAPPSGRGRPAQSGVYTERGAAPTSTGGLSSYLPFVSRLWSGSTPTSQSTRRQGYNFDQDDDAITSFEESFYPSQEEHEHKEEKKERRDFSSSSSSSSSFEFSSMPSRESTRQMEQQLVDRRIDRRRRTVEFSSMSSDNSAEQIEQQLADRRIDRRRQILMEEVATAIKGLKFPDDANKALKSLFEKTYPYLAGRGVTSTLFMSFSDWAPKVSETSGRFIKKIVQLLIDDDAFSKDHQEICVAARDALTKAFDEEIGEYEKDKLYTGYTGYVAYLKTTKNSLVDAINNHIKEQFKAPSTPAFCSED